MFFLFGSGSITGCKSPYWFGTAGPSGIDTVARLPRLPMVTTDSSLVPQLAFPDSGMADVSRHYYDSNSIKPVLRWNPVNGALSYRVVVSTNSRFAPTLIDDSTLTGADTSKIINISLDYNTDYYWAVCAKHANGDQAWSSKWSFTTKIDPLSELQMGYVAQKFGMFIHFGMSTFARYQYPDPHGEWELGSEDPNLFHPDSLNCGQWADIAKSAHCKYVVLTAKHHGGFCLWPSNGPWSAQPHGIAQSSWYSENGQRDICREFVDSVRSRGMEPGFYYSVRDETNPPTIAMVMGQLRELLSNYGDIKVIWFDGWGWWVGYYKVPFEPIAQLVHQLNDSLGHHTIISENNHKFKMWNTEIVQYEIPIDGPPLAGNNLPSEGNEPIRADKSWFWHPMNTTLLNTQFIINRIHNANAVNATYLLDLTPDTTGLIPQEQVQAMKDIGTQVVNQGALQP